jgi:hypothetical protein
MANEMPFHDAEPPRSMFSTWVGVVLLLAVFGLFVWVVIGAIPRSTNYESNRAKARAEKLEQARKDAATALTTYGWVDKDKGVARVPIDRAMQLTVAELTTKRPMPANPIATPEPQAASPAPASPAPKAAAAAPAGSPDVRTNPTPKPISVEGPQSEIRGQPTGAANPASAPPGTQPGAAATPAASPPSAAAEPNPAGKPTATPAQSPPGTPLPVPGATP